MENGKTYMIVLLILLIVGLLLNLLVVIVIAATPRIRRRRSNKFLLNLLLSDLCVTISMSSFSIHSLSLDDYEYTGGVTFTLMIATFMLLSVFNLILLTLDRLFTIKYPFHYETKFRTKHVYIIITCSWLVSLMYPIVLIILHQIYEEVTLIKIVHTSFLFLIITGSVIMSVTNAITFMIARKQLREIAKTVITTSDKAEKIKKDREKRECRLVRINVGMVFTFVLFWSPAVYCWFYFRIHQTWPTGDTVFIGWLLVSFNYICDPLIYVTLSQDVKAEIKRRLNMLAKIDEMVGEVSATSMV